MQGPLLVGLLVAIAVLIGFVGLWHTSRSRDPVDERLKEYGVTAQELAGTGTRGQAEGGRRLWPLTSRLLAGFGLGPRLATALARADVPLTAAEFGLLVLLAAVAAMAVGIIRSGLIAGLLLAPLGGYAPLAYLNLRRRKRQRAFTEQLPDVLTLITGALRAGYGLSQAIEMLTQQLAPPASKEFARVLRAVGLGLPIQQALRDMAERVDTDDLDLVVTAITVQYDMGGNLAQTLDTIGDTVRDRIRIQRQIRVLTAQQRFTGYVLAGWPLFIAAVLFILNPDYIMRLFAPGWIRLLPAAAVVMQVLGFLVIRKIVDIEV